MSYSYKCYSDTKEVMKKYVNATEGKIIYGMGKTTFMNFAREAGAVYKVGATALVNTEIFESFIEQFREEPVTPITFVGGGAGVMKQYGELNQKNISYIDDVRANAKGYEYLAKHYLERVLQNAR